MIKSAPTAFSRQAPAFDQLNAGNDISQYVRDEFRKEVLRQLRPGGRILELNCGTGLDAMYFASQGHSVMATDASEGMLAEFYRKLKTSPLQNVIEIRQVDFNQLSVLDGQKFDHVISNFGGLNCAHDLKAVLTAVDTLLNPGGKITMMIMPVISPWEIALVFKGRLREAFRRLKGHANAHIEGVHFTCYYYNPGYVKRALRSYRTVRLRGVCCFVPPEFFSGFSFRHQRLFRVLKSAENTVARLFPFSHWCDHFLITLEKRN